MVRLGVIAFANDSGLGAQTRRLVQFLKPYRIMVIDSSGFSKNTQQHFDWYENFSGYLVKGFPTNHEINVFLKDLTHVICAENPLNFHLFTRCRQLGIKAYVQSNYEFCDNLRDAALPLPHKFLMPSYWMIDEMKRRFGNDMVDYLPPPINPIEFKEQRERNIIHAGPRRALHVVGTLAAYDRNGTLDLLQAMKYSKVDFQLVIKSQHELPKEYMSEDRRIQYHIGTQPIEELYKDFDFQIIPRRYGGLCLTMNEGLMCGLPTIMTDISPNNQILPKKWLVPAKKKTEFKGRTMIDVYESDIKTLAARIDFMAKKNCEKFKVEAFELGYNNFSESALINSYQQLFT